ncbi:MAG: type I 3-dehydroquinate dehydratase [Nitrospirae bacterium]|nr:type I 3-dehydroquinate dehydratase [Nitrospirota bacterium]
MIKLGSIKLNGTPRIVLSLNDATPPHLIQEARQLGLDLVELRIDQYAFFDAKHVLREAGRFKDCSTIATIRIKAEGGVWNLPEPERLALFKKIIPEVNAVDIELSAETILPDVVRAVHAAKKIAIISYHNFDGTPTFNELNGIMDEAKSFGADIVKIAARTTKPEDMQTLAGFTIANAMKNIVVIAMGLDGALSRVFFPALGSLLTYAYLDQPTAPGQLGYRELFELLKKFYPKFNQA